MWFALDTRLDARPHPAGLLTVLAALAAGLLLLLVVSERTPDGRRVVAAARRAHRETGAAMAVAIDGIPAVWVADPAFAAEAGIERIPARVGAVQGVGWGCSSRHRHAGGSRIQSRADRAGGRTASMQLRGFTTRPATTADAPAVYDLVRACEADLDGTAEVDLDDVVTDLARPGMDLSRDTVLVHDTAGTLVAWAQVYRVERVDAQVRPGHRGQGIGRALLEWSEARVRELGGLKAGQTVTDNNTAAAALLRGRGYAATDTAWILEIRLDAEPVVPELPAGYALRTFEPGRDDQAAYRLIEDAFGEWPDRKPATFEDWTAFCVGRETFVADLSPLVVRGDEIVGAAMVLDYAEDAEGYVHQLAVHRDHRHRGLARTLLRHAFRDAYRQGRRSCCLSTNSYTGALTLYERVGMRIRRAYTHYSKPLP